MPYLDHHASTPLDERVLAEMLPWLRHAANASSAHEPGRKTRAAVNSAREQVAALTGLPAGGVVFCSGATEANNLAIASFARGGSRRTGIVISAIEHPSVVIPARQISRSGHSYAEIRVERTGVIDLDVLAQLVGPSTGLVSVQAANSEIGVIQPIDQIARIVHNAGALLHVDATQAAVGVSVPLHLADAVTLSAHKMYGPQGTGALICAPLARNSLRPLLLGGGQEQGARSGTLNVAGIVGMGHAAALAVQERDHDRDHLSRLRDRLWDHLKSAGAELNGPVDLRLPGNLNVRFDGADQDVVLSACPDVAFSAGSACAADSDGPSPVLEAIGLSAEQAEQSVRLGVGRPNTDDDIDTAAAQILRAVAMARERLEVG